MTGGDATGVEPDGVADGFDEFVHRERAALVSLAWSLTGSFPAAEELAQEALSAAWQTWGRIGAYDKPGAWARRVVVNRAANHRRRAGREARALRRLAGRRDRPDPVRLPGDDLEVWEAVRALPARQAQAIALHYLDDRSVDEVAHVLGCAPGSVKTHLHRGRVTLARALGLTGHDDEGAMR